MFGHRSTQAVCILALLVGLVVPTTGAGVPAAVGAVPVESGTKPPWSLDIGAEGYDHPAADDMRWMRLDRPGLSWGRNLATLFLDVTGRTTARPGPIPLEGGNARLLDVSTMPPKLREALRLAPDAELVATVTRPNERSLKDDPGYHSEPLVISDGMELLRVLGSGGTSGAG